MDRHVCLEKGSVMSDNDSKPRCSCDDIGESPCPVHYRENQLQDELIRVKNEFYELRKYITGLACIDYVELAMITESNDFSGIRSRLDDQTLRLVHAALGIANEAGEFAGAIKSFLFYGRKLDAVNLGEELGDLNWYEALAIDAMQCLGNVTSLNDILRKNIEKLRARYKGKFSEEAANDRDLDLERETLERR